ncbi:hypothetical protein CHS0354_041773 [Potamilus streckersoni]|uniref:Uncharacterized protein n=1 Tax=Potamilus streckersoni TaxID=2493646 RepID=A0AAE0T182_9BIVA|nr:hypothetical protein CHS0354_041773 [Potamilus streckersoni]
MQIQQQKRVDQPEKGRRNPPFPQDAINNPSLGMNATKFSDIEYQLNKFSEWVGESEDSKGDDLSTFLQANK